METRANESIGQGSVAKTDEFFHSTPDRQGLIEQLKHLLQFGEGLPALTGSAGAGKTVLLKQLCRELDSVNFCCYCPVKPESSLIDCLEQICQLVGLQVAGSTNAGEILATLRHFGQALANEQKQGVLLLDDVHHLDDSSLGALVSLVQGHDESGYGLALLFAGQSGLVERLDGLQLLDVPIFDFDTPSLSASELGAFLQVSGRLLPDSSDSDLVKHLWVQSKGNPGVALYLLDEHLKGQGSSVVRELKGWLGQFSALPLGHFAAMVLLFGILIWAVWGGGESPSKSPISPALTLPNVGVSSSAASKLARDQMKPAEIAKKVDTQTAALIGVNGASSEASVQRQVMLIPRGVASANSLAPQSASASSVASEKSIAQVKREVVVRAEPIEAPGGKVHAQSLPDYREDEIFLLAQDSAHYTLQILAASKPESLHEYIQQQSNHDKLYLYQGLREGKRWYVVVAGIYPSRNAAITGLKALPPVQKKSGPWPKKLASIKREIAENRKENR